MLCVNCFISFIVCCCVRLPLICTSKYHLCLTIYRNKLLHSKINRNVLFIHILFRSFYFVSFVVEYNTSLTAAAARKKIKQFLNICFQRVNLFIPFVRLNRSTLQKYYRTIMNSTGTNRSIGFVCSSVSAIVKNEFESIVQNLPVMKKRKIERKGEKRQKQKRLVNFFISYRKRISN